AFRGGDAGIGQLDHEDRLVLRRGAGADGERHLVEVVAEAARLDIDVDRHLGLDRLRQALRRARGLEGEVLDVLGVDGELGGDRARRAAIAAWRRPVAVVLAHLRPPRLETRWAITAG